MLRLTGLFDSFNNLDQIPAEAIASWLKNPPQLVQLENYLANKILYPQILPLTAYDMQIDLAILREALKNASFGENPFLNIKLKKILIPAGFLNFTVDLVSLTWAFVDALLLNRKSKGFGDLWTVVLTDDTDEVAGSILLPQFEGSRGVMNLKLQSKSYEVQKGSLMVIPCPKSRCEIAYKILNGRILGKTDSVVEIYGGRLGLMVDGRNV